MKKYFLIIILIFLNLFAIAQSQLDEIAQKTAEVLVKNLRNQGKDIQGRTGKYSVNIQMLTIYNPNGEQTKLSSELARRIAVFMQSYVDDPTCNIPTASYTIYSPFDFPTLDDINSTIQFDYTLIGKYEITETGITLSEFTLKQIKKPKKFVLLKKKFIQVNNINVLREYDRQSLNYLENFINLKKDNLILKSAYLSENQQVMPSVNIEGVGEVYDVNFDIDYNIKIDLAKDAYVYAFFYDPLDEKYPYLWYLENPNKIIKAGTYNDYLESNVSFYDTGNKGQYSFIKLIVSTEKLNIEKYLTKKYIEGYESVIITLEDCKKLTDEIKVKNNIQTKNLILKLQ